MDRRDGGDRREPQGWRKLLRENWYRDVWLIVITGISVYGVILAVNAATNADEAVQAQRTGRGVAIRAICGATNAVVSAGRATITGGGAGLPPKLTLFLEEHGYPPKKVRDDQAAVAAEAYAQNINSGVSDALGAKGSRLVDKDGSLNCERLVDASAAK